MRIIPGLHQARDGDIMHSKDIFESIQRGMAPFRGETIGVWIDFDIDHNEFCIVGEVRLKDGFGIAHVVRSNAFELSVNPVTESLRVALEMEKAFRNREDYPIAPQVCLGEN